MTLLQKDYRRLLDVIDLLYSVPNRAEMLQALCEQFQRFSQMRITSSKRRISSFVNAPMRFPTLDFLTADSLSARITHISCKPLRSVGSNFMASSSSSNTVLIGQTITLSFPAI